MAQHRRRGATAFCSLLAVLVLSTCGNADGTDTSAASSAEPSLAAHSGLSSYRSTRAHSETAAPVRLRIPSIDVDTGLEALGMAGYVWRVAESRAHTTDLNLRADLMKQLARHPQAEVW